MVNIKFGQKHHCWACGTRFYDLNQTPATCPKCKTVSLVPVCTSEASEELSFETTRENAVEKKDDFFFESDPLEDTRELDDGEDLRSLSSTDSSLMGEGN